MVNDVRHHNYCSTGDDISYSDLLQVTNVSEIVSIIIIMTLSIFMC